MNNWKEERMLLVWVDDYGYWLACGVPNNLYKRRFQRAKIGMCGAKEMKEEEKAARDAAKKIHTDDNNANEYEQLGFDAGWNAAIAYAKREQQWIPVGERLPETNGFYLVTIPVGDGEFDTQADAWSVSRQEWIHYRGIRAWCDLPAPYQPKTDGDKAEGE